MFIRLMQQFYFVWSKDDHTHQAILTHKIKIARFIKLPDECGHLLTI